MQEDDWQELSLQIQTWGLELGFDAVGVSDTDLAEAGVRLEAWLERSHHGEMAYMARHGSMRWQPEMLHPGTRSIITVRIDYLEKQPDPEQVLSQADRAYISRYALGRDYHKVIRGKLKTLIRKINDHCEQHLFTGFDARVFTDSAPLLEKALAEKSGLGWIGKHTLLLNEQAGSWFFLGEILTNLPLPPTRHNVKNRCGSCSACIDICPTQAITAPYTLDARRCISYLTIEHKGSIPVEFRKPMGNRVFGCDDCQMVCPWNRYARSNRQDDFKPRHGLEAPALVRLFQWTHEEFLKYTQGSAIRRTGYEGFLRNLAVGLGNMQPSREIAGILEERKGYSPLVDEHINWAKAQHKSL